MSGSTDSRNETAPLPQRILDRIWLWAIAALVFFTLSYVVWGLIDIAAVSGG